MSDGQEGRFAADQGSDSLAENAARAEGDTTWQQVLLLAGGFALILALAQPLGLDFAGTWGYYLFLPTGYSLTALGIVGIGNGAHDRKITARRFLGPIVAGALLLSLSATPLYRTLATDINAVVIAAALLALIGILSLPAELASAKRSNWWASSYSRLWRLCQLW